MEQLSVLSAVGDINLGDRAMMIGLGVRSRITQDPNYDPFQGVRQLLTESDLSFGNLECVISDSGLDDNRNDSRMMRAAPETLHLLKKGGFNLLSVANNHIMQHGEAGFTETVQSLLEEGILPVGVAGEDNRCLPRFITSKGLKFGFLGYCLRPEKVTSSPLYAHAEMSQLLEEIHSVRKECRFLIVSLHWGAEYIDYPAAWQIEAAHAMIDRGASVILGHHSHVLQGVEEYNGGVIAYSLGNFVFDVWQKRLRKTMVLQLGFSASGIMKIRRVPVAIASDFSPRLIPLNKQRDSVRWFDLLDRQLQQYPHGSIFSDKAYQKRVVWGERMNQMQNRLLFLYQFPRYERAVSLQCLSGFVRSRLKE